MTPLEELIRARIARDGPLTVAAFMSLALYHPELGYYASGGPRSGWQGHFITSAELDPAFGELWASWVHELWCGCGRPRRFDVFEIGPGEGAFAAALVSAAPGTDLGDALVVHLVERFPAARSRQRERLGERLEGLPRVVWEESLGRATPVCHGCLFANEVLDNTPAHVLERRDGLLREVFVDAAPDGLREVLHAPSDPALEARLAALGTSVEEGRRRELSLDAAALVARAARTFHTGAMVLTDYGLEATELAERPLGTLAAYSAAGAHDGVLESPGARDITAHVDWTLVRAALSDSGLEVAGPVPQRAVLESLGAKELARAARVEAARARDAGRGVDLVRALSRHQALQALTDPAGLGGMGVMVAWRGLPRAPVPEQGLASRAKGRS